jgi:hypothetical protein
MNHLESTKTVASIGTADTATDATFAHTIDTLGYDYASVDVVFEAGTASTQDLALALSLSQSDVDAATSYSTITEFVGGGSGGFTIPTSMSSTASNVARFNLDLRGKKRYLKVSATPADDSVVCSVARLGKADVGPANASEAGVAVQVSG